MFSEGLTMLGFDSNGTNSAQELSLNEESNDSSYDFQQINQVQVRKWLNT